jgi:hypothetical protein
VGGEGWTEGHVDGARSGATVTEGGAADTDYVIVLKFGSRDPRAGEEAVDNARHDVGVWLCRCQVGRADGLWVSGRALGTGLGLQA